jgi:TatD DNase family protein
MDLTREIATHFPQERLMRDHFELAQEIDLPVVVVEQNATEKVVELLHQYGAQLPGGAAIFNFMGTESELKLYLSVDECPLYFIMTGASETCLSESM